MDRCNAQSLSLASLAVSVSATALLGFATPAAADDPPLACQQQTLCYIYDPFWDHAVYHWDYWIWWQNPPGSAYIEGQCGGSGGPEEGCLCISGYGANNEDPIYEDWRSDCNE